MPTNHRCENNDHISKIAHQYHFHQWETVWDANPSLRQRRANPNILFKGDRCATGDIVCIPDIDEREESRPTEDHHVFELPTQVVFLRLRILKDDFTAIADAEYELIVTGVTEPFTGTTDGMGQIEVEIPRQTEHGSLTVRIPFEASTDPNAGASSGEAAEDAGGGDPASTQENAVGGPVPVTWTLQIGRLNPIMERAPDRWCISGVQQRLNNLALNTGPVDGIRGPNTRSAVAAFQTIFDLEVDEAPGQGETQPKLVEVHDRPDSVVGPAPEPSPEAESTDASAPAAV